MGVDHLGGSAGIRQEIQKLWRELRRVAKATLQNGSIGRAGIRVYDGGWIRIEGGGLSVTGTADVSGYLNVSGELNGTGTFAWSGPLNITGNVTSTGTLTQNGPWNLNGPGTIAGNVTQTGSYQVNSPGTIKIGTSMTLNPAGNNGRIEFANGAQVFTDGTSIQMYLGNGVAQVSNSEAKIQVGGTAVRVQSGHLYMSGMVTRTTAATGMPVNSIGYDAGEIFRVVAV